MAHKQLLHELLKEDQEPFRLKTYIADRKSQMKNSLPKSALQLKKRNPIATKRSNLSNHVCFLSFQNSPDVRRSPFLNFQSPVKSPCKSPNDAVFLHIPSRTAALLVEAAMRVQKQPKSSNAKNAGFGLFGSFLKRLKERSRKQKRAIQNSDLKVEETVRISCSCSNRKLSSAEWTENNEDKSMDFEASTSSCGSECSEHDFASSETRFCLSPFRFSLQGSPCGGRTPDFCSPAASPSRHVRLDDKKYESRNSDNVQGGEEEEKEQCSPVSVLDPLFDEDDGHESRDAEEDDYDLECSYENVQRAKQQLLHRLRRFEKLAELDPMELERKLLEGSDEEDNWEREASEDDESLYESSLQHHTRNISTDMKRLVSDLIVEEKREAIHSGANDVVMGRIRTRFDLWKEVEFNTIDMMVGLDLKRESGGWTKFDEQIGETTAEIEVGILALLIEELSDEFCC